MTLVVLALAAFLALPAHAGVKTAGVGHIQLPAAPAAGVSITSGAANTYTTSAVAIGTTPSAVFITGIHVEAAAAMAGTYISVQLMVGANAIGQYLVPLSTGSTVALGFRPIWPPIPVATATSVTAKTADSVGSKATLVSLEIIAQSNVVDDAIPVTTVTTVTNQLTAAQVATGVWQDTTAGDFTVSSSIGKSVMNGIALGTGLTVNDITTKTGYSLAASQHVIVDSGTVTTVTNQLTAAAIATGIWQDTTAGDFTTALSVGKSLMNGVSLGTGLTVNDLTTKTGYSLAASQHVIVDSGTVTTLTNLPAITANWLTAAGINAGALNGKGDWLLSSSYTAPSNLTAAQIATGVWQDTTAGDFTTSASVGKSVMNGVSLGTGLTVASVSGAVGSVTGLTASNLDATVSSRMATYTQPTGFLAATFPSGTIANTTNLTAGTVAAVTNRVTANTDQLAGQTVTAAAGVTFPSSVASPTNITAGTITTATNLTNAPTAGDFTAAMKTSLNAATPASVSGAVGSVTGSVGSVVGLTASNLDTTVSSRLATSGYTAPDNTRPTNFTALAITGGGAVTAGTVSDKTGYALTAAYDAAKTAAQVGDAMAVNSTGINSIWNEPLSSHTTAGTAGKALSTAGSGADPWAITLPGAYGAGSAGYIVGTYLDLALSSRAAAATALSTATWTGPRAVNLDNLDAAVSTIKAKTDSLTFSVAGKVDANAKAVNGVSLVGTGRDTDPWGPAP